MRFSSAKEKCRRFPYVAAAWIVFLYLASAAWGASDSVVGSITSSVPQAGAVREGKRALLAVGDEIFVDDTLFTDEAGQLEVAFEDGTTLGLGPSSEVQVRDFAMTEDKNSFHSEIIRGAARLVTGDLVKRNPGGFKISTPRSTIGIRGTEVLAVVRGGDEILMVPVLGGRREGDTPSVSDSSHVTVIDRRSGQIYRITEPGLVFTHSRSGPSRLTRPNPDKRAAIEVLIRMTEVPTEGVQGIQENFDNNVDKVLTEQPDEVERAPETPGFPSSRRPVPTPGGTAPGFSPPSNGNGGAGDGPSDSSSGAGRDGGRDGNDGKDRADDSWKNELPGESVVGGGDPRRGGGDEVVKIGSETVIPVPRLPSVCD
jgi:hypothetical protein